MQINVNLIIGYREQALFSNVLQFYHFQKNIIISIAIKYNI